MTLDVDGLDALDLLAGRVPKQRGPLREAAGDSPPTERVQVDGKFFSVAGTRFAFRGVTYGTFRPRESDGARFPETAVMARDFAAMRAAGFTVVRTYTPPPEDLLRTAGDWGLRVLAGVFYPDWRYVLGSSRRDMRRVTRQAEQEVRDVAHRLRGDPRVLGLSLGNEIPADVLRWFGTRRIVRVLERLVDVVREEDPELLVTYANYPTTEYLQLDSIDFLTFNVFLESQQDFRRYLTRLHHLAGDRPLVLGEVGLHVDGSEEGEARQARTLAWQLETALERGIAGTCLFSWTDEWWVGDAAVEGWRFGLTRADRSPRPALAVAARANRRSVRDVLRDWPTMTVVVCAYNAQATIGECLRHACALDYPDLEILVIDDGSTDDTAAITKEHPAATLVTIEHAGLSVARNEGYRLARGDIVAYLDSDAYPTPEWPYYLALAFDMPDVNGAGGPNVPPRNDPPSAQAVARAPGGPVHVLLTDDRAEHVPGCNMAFWKRTLIEVGGFDPIYTSAGDDVSLCWKVLDAGGEIAFHPAALVWHHRRAGLRAYLKQQRGYGRSEALVEARHPDRFTPTGTARWHGRIYDSFAPGRAKQRIYRGEFGAAAYQSVYRNGGFGLDLAHQLGVPFAAALVLTAPLVAVRGLLALPAASAVVFLLGLGLLDASRADPARTVASPALFRLQVAVMHVLQPVVRLWGRSRNRGLAWRDLPPAPALPGPVVRRRGTLVLPVDRPRADLALAVLMHLHKRGWRTQRPSGWEDYDVRLPSLLMHGDVLTSSYPEGSVQLRVRRRARGRRIAAFVAALWVLSMLSTEVFLIATGLLLAALCHAELRLQRALTCLAHPVRRRSVRR